MNTTTYPISPSDLPAKLTALSPSYLLRAFLAILSIILFFALYTSLVAGMGYVVYMAIMYEMESFNKLTILLKIGSIAGAIALLIFTLKFIFKLRNPKPENRIKLDKKAHPELIKFVENICKETGAPRPKSIYVDPDVNAYVNYSNMWLSLFLPVRKDLTLGLGLINCLNLSEFKAVTTHEFGHFAQRSMKIGSYIISANTIIHDMIFERDKFDDLLEQWRGADIRLSFFAWLITPVIWLVRQLLRLFYIFLNIMYSSLSREMEFNADKVAVSTTGSEAIVSALWKLDGGSESWNNTLNHAYMASQKQMYSENLYQHNTFDLGRNIPKLEEALHALPQDENGSKKFFINSEASKVNMYASHPPNDQREISAKKPFVACPIDDRSPWILFSDAEAVQKDMTKLVYEKYWGKVPDKFASIDEFEAFIKAESHGKELMEAYFNTFEHRFLHIPSEEEIEQVSVPDLNNPENSLQLLKDELAELVKPVQEIETLMKKATQMAEGTLKEDEIIYNEVSYKKKELENLYNQLLVDREQLFNEHFINWDTKFCAFHLALAQQKGSGNMLNNLYQQHDTLNKFYKVASQTNSDIFGGLQALQQRGDLEQSDVTEFGQRVIGKVKNLNWQLAKFDNLPFVSLPNIHNTQELKCALVENGEYSIIKGDIFENGDFNRTAPILQNSIFLCQRLDQKSIAYILTTHLELY